MAVVNNQETNIDDPCFYVDEEGRMYDAVVKSIVERDGNHYADLKINKDGKQIDVIDVPHNTSPEKHSWNHPRSKKEVKSHYHPNFYGSLEEEEEDEEDDE